VLLLHCNKNGAQANRCLLRYFASLPGVPQIKQSLIFFHQLSSLSVQQFFHTYLPSSVSEHPHLKHDGLNMVMLMISLFRKQLIR